MITEKLILLILQLLNDFSSHSEDNIQLACHWSYKFLLNSRPIIEYTFLKTSVRKGIASVSEVVKMLCSTLELPEDYHDSLSEFGFKSLHCHNKLPHL